MAEVTRVLGPQDCADQGPDVIPKVLRFLKLPQLAGEANEI